MTSNQEDQSIDTNKAQVLPYEGRNIKFVVLEAKVAKSCDSIWLHYLRAEEKFKNNRYLACCVYCHKIMQGRTAYLKNHLAKQCHSCPPEISAAILITLNKKAKSVIVAEEMIDFSQKKFEEGEDIPISDLTSEALDNPAYSPALPSINQFFEKKKGTGTQEALHVLLLQALIWDNISFNFLNNPFFIRFLAKLRPSYKLLSTEGYSSRIFNSISAQVVLQNIQKINSRVYDGE